MRFDSEFELIIRGWDGSEFTVHGPRAYHSPIRLLKGNLGDFYEPPMETTYKAVVGQAGASLRGWRRLERYITLPMGFFGSRWREEEARFRRAFRPDRDTELVVRTRHSGQRRIRVRLAEAPEVLRDIDPGVETATLRTFSLVAGDPWWYGEEHRDEFIFDGSNWAGDTVLVDNPADAEVWPSWVLTAPAKFGLPDVDLTVAEDRRQDRFVYLPFQPTGRTVRVNTDPLAEMIVANDATLLWAQMNGQFFLHPIPAGLGPTRLPVYVDPFPLLHLPLPAEWRIWIASKLREWCTALGIDAVLALTPEDIGNRIGAWVREITPDWVPALPDRVHGQLTAELIAKLLRESYGRIGNIAGATAQIRLERRWQRPWG